MIMTPSLGMSKPTEIILDARTTSTGGSKGGPPNGLPSCLILNGISEDFTLELSSIGTTFKTRGGQTPEFICFAKVRIVLGTSSDDIVRPAPSSLIVL